MQSNIPMRFARYSLTAVSALSAVFFSAGHCEVFRGAEGLRSFRVGVRAGHAGRPAENRARGAAFKGPAGEPMFMLEASPRGAALNPPSVFRSEVRAVPFDGAVMLLLDHYSQPGPVKYTLYAAASAAGERDSLEFEAAAVLEPHDFDYIHAGLTNFVEYYYIVTALDLKTGEHSAVSDRIAFAVPGEGGGGYLDEAGKYED